MKVMLSQFLFSIILNQNMIYNSMLHQSQALKMMNLSIEVREDQKVRRTVKIKKEDKNPQ